MANWIEVEKKLTIILNDAYYRQNNFGITSPADHARRCVQHAQGSALPSYSGEITVEELQHPSSPGRPTRLVRGFDSAHEESRFGAWWIDSDLFDRFLRATTGMPAADREKKIKAFMRARSAVSHDWSNMAGLAELKLPVGFRTPALIGKAHYQRFITDPKHPDYVPNVFLMGGDLQFYVCVRDHAWIRPLTLKAAIA